MFVFVFCIEEGALVLLVCSQHALLSRHACILLTYLFSISLYLFFLAFFILCILSDFYLDALNDIRPVFFGVKYLPSAKYLDVKKVSLNSLSQICSLSKVAIFMPGLLLANILLPNFLKYETKINVFIRPLTC